MILTNNNKSYFLENIDFVQLYRYGIRYILMYSVVLLKLISRKKIILRASFECDTENLI